MANSKAPLIKEPGFFPFPDYDVCVLDNGIKIHVIPFNSLGYTNIILSVKAGSQLQTKLLQASVTGRMLREGCEGFSSEELAEELDYYGTVFRAGISYLTTDMILSSVSRHLPKMVPLFHSMVFKPTFTKKEFATTCSIGKQNIIHSLQEVSYLANKQFKQMLFGEKHPYGMAADPEDYDALIVEDLKAFHSQYYLPQNIELFVTGKIADSEFALLNETFGKTPLPADRLSFPQEPKVQTCTEVKRVFEKEGCLQSAVFMGCVTIPQLHPDFLKLKLLVSVLGGYFGSRLMSNIREDKGYTYGIYAQLVAYTNFSTIVISSQTAVEHTNDLISEVYKEIDRLIDEPVPNEELDMVKRYFVGLYLQQASKGIDLISDYRVKVLNNIDTKGYYQQWWDVLHSTTAEELQQIACKYLIPSDFRISVAGKC